MGTVDDILASAKQLFHKAAQKGGELTDIANLRIRKAGAESERARVFERLGRMVYDSRSTGIQSDEAISSAIAEVDVLSAKIHNLEAREEQLRSIGRCAACGGKVAERAAFCPACGAPQKPAPEAEPAGPPEAGDPPAPPSDAPAE